MADFTPTERTQVRRLSKRGVYDREAVYRILDEGLVCHVGFVADGKPVVIPTGYGRKDDMLYIHGSTASRMFRVLGSRCTWVRSVGVKSDMRFLDRVGG